MAEKARPFSIYLLREGYDATNSLTADHNLEAAAADNLPAGGVIYILDADRRRPWWRSYFGIAEDIWQEFKGALLFLPVEGRCFAVCFGQVHHNLKDVAYEYDFGLRVTLNMLDPRELRSADMVEPGPARRKRTQVPISTELTYLDFDANSEIIKSLTGKVKPEFEDLFKSATGSASLKIGLKIDPEALSARCSRFLELYESDEYKTSFPNIENISPVRNPADVAPLDAKLLASIKERDGATTLTIPDIVDYKDNTCCMFGGGDRPSQIYPDISIEKFYEYIGEEALENLSLDALKRDYRLILTDTEGSPDKSYGLYRSVIFDVEPGDEESIYHLCEGAWYKVERAFATRLKTYLDAKCEPTDLGPYNHDVIKKGKRVYSEESYNSAMAAAHGGLLCLDQTDISPSGATAIEPCDIYTARPDGTARSGQRGIFYHIKISTRSSHLSHLFNQGVNSVELITHEVASREKMEAIVVGKLGEADPTDFLAPFQSSDYKIVFGIITHKDWEGASSNLPLFSKLSLMRNMQRLDFARIPSSLTFIPDHSEAKDGHMPYQSYLVEVVQNGKKNVVRVVDGQGLDTTIDIKRCPKEVSESAAGVRFELSVKVREDGYSSSHHWPFTKMQ
ncbi:DUF6119 family protein [Rhizobium miluonense]|uniref:Sporadically distributed protein, TIGR04141 family n=1 Tax=Rhizobium miluonense TaxID=411945 RepID=A0A1C3X8A4_9HYPH|nr:TIGR04141 family sporadically distributed protein [Rhizobium miluonense]SCB48214.1 sporadically distributed protein, TIGR04141 family [Rhizobium miluonense]